MPLNRIWGRVIGARGLRVGCQYEYYLHWALNSTESWPVSDCCAPSLSCGCYRDYLPKGTWSPGVYIDLGSGLETDYSRVPSSRAFMLWGVWGFLLDPKP